MTVIIVGSIAITLLIANIVMSVRNLLKDMDSTRIVFGFFANAVAVPCLIILAAVCANVFDFL